MLLMVCAQYNLQRQRKTIPQKQLQNLSATPLMTSAGEFEGWKDGLGRKQDTLIFLEGYLNNLKGII